MKQITLEEYLKKHVRKASDAEIQMLIKYTSINSMKLPAFKCVKYNLNNTSTVIQFIQRYLNNNNTI